MRILIGGPARQDIPTFIEHLKSIEELELPEGCSLHKFYIINDCPELKPLLKYGESIEINTGDEYVRTEDTHYWSDGNLSKMSVLRNKFLEQAHVFGYDYAFFVDSDLVLNPETLKWLLAAKKDIIAEIFWTQDRPGSKSVWPNCWDYDQAAFTDESLKSWMKPGVYKVGGTGACMLLSRKVLDAGVNYDPIYNVRKVLKGEDRWFMIRAVCAGFELFIDTHAPAWHLYRPSELERFKRFMYGDS